MPLTVPLSVYQCMEDSNQPRRPRCCTGFGWFDGAGSGWGAANTRGSHRDFWVIWELLAPGRHVLGELPWRFSLAWLDRESFPALALLVFNTRRMDSGREPATALDRGASSGLTVGDEVGGVPDDVESEGVPVLGSESKCRLEPCSESFLTGGGVTKAVQALQEASRLAVARAPKHFCASSTLCKVVASALLAASEASRILTSSHSTRK
jgi:hypothetical protein